MLTPSYDDAYSSCEETYSTLRVYHEALHPSETRIRLGIEPSRQITKGIRAGGQKRPGKINGWFLSSEGKINSRDSRRHIDWLLDQLDGKEKVLQEMLESGYHIDISSFWISATGNGGPSLSPYQMQRLARFQIEVWWDVYIFDDEN